MNQYFEQMILTASPVELVRLLYEKAILSVREAREHLKHGRIRERGQSINLAYLVLLELTTSLNPSEAPELSRNLSGLYVYMQGRLLEANMRQQDQPLAEVLSLLTTLQEAWKATPETAGAPPSVEAGNGWSGAATEAEPVRLALSA